MKTLSTRSVIIIVKNKAKYPSDCLATVARLADEIIILDSASIDDNAAISTTYNAKFYVNSD